MKLQENIFIFLGLLLIFSSLYHLYKRDEARHNKTILTRLLNKINSINNNLYQKYSDVYYRYHSLKHMSANKIGEERFLAKQNKKHAVAMTNIIPLQYERLKAISNSSTPISLKEHLSGQKVKNNYPYGGSGGSGNTGGIGSSI